MPREAKNGREFRLASMTGLVVKELTPSMRDDFLTFFDNVTFADDPDWSDCYSSLYHLANRGDPSACLQPD